MSYPFRYSKLLKHQQSYLLPYYIPQLIRNGPSKTLRDATVNILYKVSPKTLNPNAEIVKKQITDPQPSSSHELSKPGVKNEHFGLQSIPASIQSGGGDEEPASHEADPNPKEEEKELNLDQLTSIHFEDSDSSFSTTSFTSDQEEAIDQAFSHGTLKVGSSEGSIESPSNDQSVLSSLPEHQSPPPKQPKLNSYTFKLE